VNSLRYGSRLRGLLCAAVLAGSPVLAAHPDHAESDPKAVQLLGEVVKSYQGLKAYSDQGEFVSALTVGGKAQKESLPMRITLVRPNKLSIDTGEVRVVSDGKTLTTVVGPTKKYTTADAPKEITFDTFRSGPLGSLLFGGPAAPTSAIFLSLLADRDPTKLIGEVGGALKLEEDRKVDGENRQSMLIDLPKGADFRLLVDPKTKLLTAIQWVVDPKEVAADAPPGQKLTVDHIGWSAGRVATSGAKDDAFAFTPPAGYTKVEKIGRDGREVLPSPFESLVGKPAPDFKTTIVDPSGKTRTLSKADLAGKVVMIDFWATWCPPCREELPEIQKMIEAYAKDKKDVIILLQSVDEKPREIADLKKLIDETFKEEKVTLPDTPVGLLAVDPGGELSETFKIEGIPALLILDGKGIVQAAYVGKQTREDLTRDLDALLAGKSLAKPKPAEADAKK
jgi:thiol-disulfide isomerase/thioredoxin